MGLTNKKPAYAIADGDHNFDSVAINHARATVQVFYSDIAVSDVQLELHQSIDNVNFDLVSDSTITVNKDKPSHSWNVIGITPGLFIRVALIKGTAEAGTIDTIYILSNE